MYHYGQVLMEKEQLHNKVIREILALIFSGIYAVGQRLPAERALCKQFSISRGTLRKALANLASMRVISIKPNSGIYVEKISRAKLPKNVLPLDFGNVNLRDIIDARKAIELAAVERACEKITLKQWKDLAHLLEEMISAIDDLPKFLKLDMQFHQALVGASGNVVLITAFQAIYEYHRFSSVFTSQQEGEEELALDYHSKLLSALEKHNVRASRKILAKHLDHMRKYSQTGQRKAV